jgi:hypothetical protein
VGIRWATARMQSATPAAILIHVLPVTLVPMIAVAFPMRISAVRPIACQLTVSSGDPIRRSDKLTISRVANGAGHALGGIEPFSSEMVISTRRFCWRPAEVLLLATGSAGPNPRVTMRWGLMP